MKTLYCTLLLLILCYSNSHSQNNQWVWVSGDMGTNHATVYGTKGVASPANMPGSRWGAVSWADADGNFWLFGGQDYTGAGSTGLLNDLWKYNITANQWTWVSGDNTFSVAGIYGTKGIAAASNKPGSRMNAVSWTDKDGNLWLFGGYGKDSTTTGGVLNDLWKYNITTNQWTWMSGAKVAGQVTVFGTKGQADVANLPGSRQSASGVTDKDGNLWLFGGSVGNLFNELWKYDVANNLWTWVSGDNVPNQRGIYGSIGISDPTNKPGARNLPSTWCDVTGNIWVFGGSGLAETGSTNTLNDLWRYNVSTGEWTWMKGDKTGYVFGVYGTKGIASATNKPGSRFSAYRMTTGDNVLWLFGGYGNASSAEGYMNDLWKYDVASDQWTWISGDNQPNQISNYGTKGVPAATNIPASRNSGVSWVDADDNLWVWGGQTSGGAGRMNDLWKFTPVCVSSNPVVTAARDTICKGTPANLTVTGSAGSVVWQYSTSLLSFSDLPNVTNTLLTDLPAEDTYYRVISGTGICSDTSSAYQIVVKPSPVADFDFTQSGLDFQFNSDSSKGDIVLYNWDFGDGTVSSLSNPSHTFSAGDTFHVCLTVYNGSNCSFTLCKDVTTDFGTGVSLIPNTDLPVIYPNPVRSEMNVINLQSVEMAEISDITGRIRYQGVLDGEKISLNMSEYPAGIYFIKFKSKKGSVTVLRFAKD